MADFIYINPQYADELRRERLLNLKRLLAWIDGECVGEHGPREVRRISLPSRPADQVYYLRKDHRIGGHDILGDLKQRVSPRSRCFKTYRAMTWLDEAGIDTMKLVCLIERRHVGLPTKAAAIVTGVPGRNVYDVLRFHGRPGERAGNPRKRTRLLIELGQLFARLHLAKLAWPDAVAKHVYVEPARNDTPKVRHWHFALIDVENMHRRFSAAERTRQINQLLVSLRGLLTATDVLRILTGYIGIKHVRARTVRRRMLEKFFPDGFVWIRRARQECAALRHFPNDRPLPEEDWFIRTNGVTVNMRFREHLEHLGLTGDAMLRFTGGSELYKPGLGGRYRYRFEIRDRDKTPLWLYLKRTRHPALKEQVSRILSGSVRHSSCWHERVMIKQLALKRIPVPVVVAYGEKMLLGYERASVLITQGIVGQPLERFVPKYFARNAYGEELARRRRWIRLLAEMIRRFHLAGYCHRDLYLSHIIIGIKRDDRPVFHLIDLARCFKMRRRKQRWIVKDLAALNYSAGPCITRTDRLRFVRTYLAVDHVNHYGKRLIARIVAKSDKIARHDLKHKRITVERPNENRPDPRTT